ncbi:E3 ubiquitin-protein ligase RNF168 [Clonorchis sinensis]|uniref:RING-type E3 ubiquitin transferase n=1 Tax=Clonorchis sinensis TaxID=79923 RepID=G7YSR5_CLOSI|nr:E3 ubiquitin-protein ligase RNF168 [Clonorchis sinensis]
MTDQVTCVICLGILYRPAVLPCKHVFCQECILSAVEKTAYQCPICRCRISNWLRKLKDQESLVNEDHENQLREMFPRYYHSKEVGLSPVLSKSEQRCLKDLTSKFELLHLNSHPRHGSFRDLCLTRRSIFGVFERSREISKAEGTGRPKE